ncbi:MAG: clostripain-related cysteine peptidase [Candidatus Bathyarchaeia archaeon]|nr:clostripain-related cysteine peptidase [Candidatus Bathyarchaeia archaeon]
MLWDHGGGYPGVCWDDTNDEDCLTTIEVKQALANVYATTSKKIDVLAFDACLMGTIEVAYQIRDYVDFMVGSEENEPGDGYPYDMILAELAANPTMNPTTLATTIVNKYINSYTDGQLNPEDDAGVTNAALNLTKIDEVAAAVSQLAGAIIDDFENSKNALAEAREQAETFHGDFVDFQDFAQLLKNTVSNTTIKAATQTVIDVIANFVVSEGHGNAHPRAHGVSIYYPRKYDKQSYITLDFADNTMWDEFLDFTTNIEATITPVCPIYITQENVTFMDVTVGDVDGDAEYEIVAVG